MPSSSLARRPPLARPGPSGRGMLRRDRKRPAKSAAQDGGAGGSLPTRRILAAGPALRSRRDPPSPGHGRSVAAASAGTSRAQPPETGRAQPRRAPDAPRSHPPPPCQALQETRGRTAGSPSQSGCGTLTVFGIFLASWTRRAARPALLGLSALLLTGLSRPPVPAQTPPRQWPPSFGAVPGRGPAPLAGRGAFLPRVVGRRGWETPPGLQQASPRWKDPLRGGLGRGAVLVAAAEAHRGKN